MATRATEKLQHATSTTFTAYTADIPEGTPVTFQGTSDLVVRACTQGEMPIAFAETLVKANTQGTFHLAGPVKEMIVDPAGSSTHGKSQVVGASGGVTDAPAPGGGTTAYACLGFAIQTGVASDHIGVVIHPHYIFST